VPVSAGISKFGAAVNVSVDPLTVNLPWSSPPVIVKATVSLASSVTAKVPIAVWFSEISANAVVVITGFSLTLTTVTDTVSTSVNPSPSVAVIWTS